MIPKAIHISDSIDLKSINTGGQSVGNGGDGNSSGPIINKPTLIFDPTNKAEGADVSVNTGDHVKQTADWDASARTRQPRGLRRLMGERPSRTGARNRTAAMTPRRSTRTRMPPRSTRSGWTSTRTWWPASAAVAETAMPHWAERWTSTSTRSDQRLARGGDRRRVPPVEDVPPNAPSIRCHAGSTGRHVHETQAPAVTKNADAALPNTDLVTGPDSAGGGALGLRGPARPRVRIQLQLQSASVCALDLPSSDL